MARAYIGLGSNQGDRMAHLAEALAGLRRLGEVERFSRVYETEPVGFLQQPDFLNAACCLNTDLDPPTLLFELKRIEGALGRRPTFPNGPRPIDLDLLLYDDRVIDTPELRVPHPRLAERAFVLVPLMDIAPGVLHPELGRTVADLWSALESEEGVRPYVAGGAAR
jgi:2-amino-4-hydroxy-6-hydroxymethyldihydropteridine diphosphokinase